MPLRPRAIEPMRICVIGNSHAAMIKGGWDRIAAEYPGVSLTFFASPGGAMSQLAARDGRLVARRPELRQDFVITSGGMQDIDPAQFDVFVTCGMKLSLRDPDPRLSSALRTHLLASQMQSLNLTCARLVRGVTDKPVLLLPIPLRAAEGPEPEGEAETARKAYAAKISALSNMVATDRLIVVGQPASTIGAGGVTEARWSRGSVKLDHANRKGGDFYGDHDRAHMNADFGALWLRELLPVAAELVAMS